MARERVPIKSGLFTWPAEHPELVGSRCRSCAEAAFPAASVCAHCGSRDCCVEPLGRRGRLWTWTIQGFKPKPPYRCDQGDDEFAPYGVGYVELDSRIRIESRLTAADPAALRIGMPMRLVVEKLYSDAARDYVCFAFEPDAGASIEEPQ